MDAQTKPQASQPATPPPPHITPINPKRNWTPILIILVVLAAMLITGGVYYFGFGFAKSPSKSYTATKSTSLTADKAQWQKYTDVTNNYSFYYPETWTLTRSSSDPTAFQLHYSDSQQPGVIEAKFLTKQEQDKTVICDKLVADQVVCKSNQVTATTKAYMELTMENKTPYKARVMIARPHEQVLFIDTTTPNFDSYKIVAVMLDTLQFGNEKRSNPLQICPDSWSANKKSVTYHSATFAASDIDQNYIQTSCKK